MHVSAGEFFVATLLGKRCYMRKRILFIANMIGIIMLVSYILIIPRALSYIVSAVAGISTEYAGSSAIGIIGGADGPTAIFLTSRSGISPMVWFIAPPVLIMLLLICNSIYIARRHR